jgi:hypothetical protein
MGGGAQPCNPNTCFATTFSCTSLVPPSIEFACERSHRRAVFLCAVKHGFRPHAGVFRDADDCEVLEQVCRHITRPALANERRHCNAAGQVVLKRKRAWHDDTTDLVISPMVFM